MCNKKFRQKQGLNAHVKANRCKVGPLRGITNSPGSNSSSSTHSERSNSPRTVPYPTANQNRAPGLNPNIKPKENVLSPAALLKLLSQPITVSNSVHGYGTPTLSPTNQISLTGLQNLSNLIQTMRENNLRLPQSTATIPPRPTAVKTSTSFQPRFPFTESTRSPIGHPLANPIGHLADQSEGSNEEAEIEEVEIVELDESSEDLMKIPSREDSRISSSSPTSDDSSSSTTVGNNNRKGRRKQGKYIFFLDFILPGSSGLSDPASIWPDFDPIRLRSAPPLFRSQDPLTIIR